MSDDDEDVIVLQVCANKQCLGIEDLEFDEESGEMYCVNCRNLYARAEKEGFRILLSTDDKPLVEMIFKSFGGGKGYWTYEDFERFQEERCHSTDTEIDSPLALKNFFKEEYDIDISHGTTGEYVVVIENLEDMYGGYLYNNTNALHADCEFLEEGSGMALFKRPHLRACEDYVDIAVNLESIRRLQSYGELLQLLRVELEAFYGTAPSEFRNLITYSTRMAPHSFSCYFCEHQLEILCKYDASVERAKQLSTEYQTALEEHELLVESHKNSRLTRRKRAEEAKSQKRLKELHREVLTVEYEAVCLSKKLKNIFEIEAIRVPLT